MEQRWNASYAASVCAAWVKFGEEECAARGMKYLIHDDIPITFFAFVDQRWWHGRSSVGVWFFKGRDWRGVDSRERGCWEGGGRGIRNKRMKLGGGVIKLLRIICKAGGLRCRDKKECNGWEWCVVRGEIVSECRSEFIYRRNSEGARRNSNREMEVDDADDATKGEAVGEEGEHDVLVSEERALHSISDHPATRSVALVYCVYTIVSKGVSE